MAAPTILKKLGPQQVRILQEDGQVDQSTVTLSRVGKDQVTWFAHGSHKATIVFASPDGSPFHDTTFQVPAGGSVASGPAKTTAQYKPYKYIVIGEQGVNDPKVIIQP
ncbi:MAG TPA: hypothetical protein VJN64_14590 [Terriglobales bacterium]|nr:hypothetical protein [Terriglobales bacterium]